MYFPVADIELSPVLPLVIGFAVSVVGSPAGVSGAFLILPISMNFLGFVSPAVSPTNYMFNVLGLPAGLWRFHREKRLMWGLGGLIALASLPGILAGTALRGSWLKEADDFRIFVAMILSALALSLLRSIVGGGRQASARAEENFAASHGAPAGPGAAAAARMFKRLGRVRTESPPHLDPLGLLVRSYGPRNIRFDFGGQAFTVPTLRLAAVSLAVGLAGGIYGIGGSAIMAPVLLGWFRLPVYVVSGASLLAAWVCSLAGMFSYMFFWPWLSGRPPIPPDLALGALFGLGGLLGIYCGTSLQRFLPPRPLKIIMLVLIAALAAQNFGLF